MSAKLALPGERDAARVHGVSTTDERKEGETYILNIMKRTQLNYGDTGTDEVNLIKKRQLSNIF